MKKKINIVYEDKEILVVNKPAGLLTISTKNEREKTLYHQVYTYLKAKHKNNRVYIVHRLDKDTSGLIVFAKSEDVKNKLQDNWDKIVSRRGYVAVVTGITKDKGTIRSYLKETKTLVTYSTNDKSGKLAITHYNKIKNNATFSLIDITIDTGRKNQIRVHLSDIGHSIIGDKKYGTEPKAKRMMLHAYILNFKHPKTDKELEFTLPIPNEFLKLVD